MNRRNGGGNHGISDGLISTMVLNRGTGSPALRAIALAQPQIQGAPPAPLAEVLATVELEQRAVTPGPDAAPTAKVQASGPGRHRIRI